MQRREFLKRITQTVGTAAVFDLRANGQSAAVDPQSAAAREYLRSIRPSRERVIQFTDVMTSEEAMLRSNGWTYDAELGWVHCNTESS